MSLNVPPPDVLVEAVGPMVVGLVEVRQRVAGEVGEDRREAVGVVLADPARVGDVLEVVVAEVPVETVLARERALERLPGGVAGKLLGPVAEIDALAAGAVVVGEGHAADDVALGIEPGAGGHVRERAVAVVAQDLRRSAGAARHVVRGDDEVRPAAAREVDELRHPRVRGDPAEASRSR